MKPLDAYNIVALNSKFKEHKLKAQRYDDELFDYVKNQLSMGYIKKSDLSDIKDTISSASKLYERLTDLEKVDDKENN